MTNPAPLAPAEADIPDFATLAADPEIAPLLRFDPVVRKIRRPDGWTPELQRELIARIAATGTVQAAVWQMGKHATGAEALYKTPGAASFRTSWDAAIIIGRRRNGLDSQPPFLGEVPGIARRKPKGKYIFADPHGEAEAEQQGELMRLAELARDSISKKLLGWPLLPRLARRIASIARGLSLGLGRRSRRSGLGGIVRRFRFRRRFLGGRFLGPGRFALLPLREALGGELLVDRRARAILVQRLLLGGGCLAGAVLE